MSKIEKQMIAALLVMVVSITYLVFSISNSIEDAGGFSGLIIEAGKEIKDISHEINKHSSGE